MRVLLAASKYLPEYTGAAVRIHRLYRALRSRYPEWSFEVLTGGVEYNGRGNEIIDDIPVYRIESYSASAWGRGDRGVREWLDVVQAFSLLRKCDFDVLHTIGTGPVVAAGIAHARRRGIPQLIELVTDGAIPDQGLPLLRRVFRPDVRQQAAIVAISKPLAELCRKRGYGRNLWARPNPVDTERFFVDRAAKAKLRSALTPFSDTDIVLLSVAKFMAQKNQIFLLDVLEKLDDRFKLILAGPLVQRGPLHERDHAYLGQVKEKIARLGIADRVQLIPDFVETHQLMKASDIFMMPSVQEGLGTPVLEARACAVPVIANAAVPAFAPHVDHGKTGYLLNLDALQWADAVRGVLSLHDAALHAAAAETASRHSEAVVQDRYAILLKHLSGSKRGEPIDVKALFGDH